MSIAGVKKYLPTIAIVAIVIGTIIYATVVINIGLNAITASAEVTEYEFKQLADNLVRSSTHYVETTDELNSILASYSIKYDAILEHLEALDVEPYVVTHTTGTVEGTTIVIEVDNLSSIPRDFIFRTAAGMPVAEYHIIEDSISGEIDLTTTTHEFEVIINNVVAIDDTNSPVVITEATISSSGNEEVYPIYINTSTSYFVEPDPAKFRFWDPHIDISLFGGLALDSTSFRAGGDLGFTVMTYGSNTEETLRVLRVGVGTNGNSIGITAAPVGYNIGAVLPLIEDLWTWPIVYWGPADNDIIIGISFGTTL